MDAPPELPLEIMHATYNRLTGFAVPFKPYERLWADSVRDGVTSEHLVLVIEHIQAQNRKSDMKISLRLDKLLGEQERFWGYWGEADLAVRERAAKARQWKASPGQQARSAMCQHEPVPPETEPRLAREVVLANLEKLKAEIGRQV